MRRRRAGRRRPRRLPQRLPVRAGQGRPAAAAGPPPGGRGAGDRSLYCNQVGGQDELVFDGDSMAVSADGELLARAPQFVEHLLTVDLTIDPSSVPSARDGRIGPMTVTRHVLSEEPVPAFEAAAGLGRRAADRLRGGLAGARPGAQGLHRQERHAVGRARPLRRHRLGRRRGDRRRRARCRPRPRRRTAVEVLQRALAAATRRTSPPAWACTTRWCRSRRWSTPTTGRSS